VKFLRYTATWLLIVVVLASPVFANPRFDRGVESYIYFRFGATGSFIAVPAPAPYRWVRSVYAHDLGVDNLIHINEITYHNGRFFMTNGPTIVVTDYDLNMTDLITGVEIDGVFTNFTTLDGIFVCTHTSEVYVAEPGSGRILHFDFDMNLIRVLGFPAGFPVSPDFNYRPLKVATDHHGRIYVIAQDVFEGILELDVDGSFIRYFGVINVRFTVAELFWRQFRSAEQRARMSLALPTSFVNLTAAPDGFIFATETEGATDQSVRKLNSRGENILRMPSDEHHVGDLVMEGFFIEPGVPMGPSIISHIHVTDFGVYYALDRNRNRVFAYDEDGHLLFAFGGSGTREGFTQNAVGMAVSDNHLIIADRGSRTLEIFELTSYGSDLLTAARLQHHADWEGAVTYWRRVLDLNPHFQYAHLGIGRWYYRNGYFHEAVHHFQRAQNVEYYNRAFTHIRREFFDRNFTYIVIAIFGAAAIYASYKIVRKVRANRKVVREGQTV